MTKPLDQDAKVLAQTIKALDQSTSRRMLRANLDFLRDRYFINPARNLPEHLKKDI